MSKRSIDIATVKLSGAPIALFGALPAAGQIAPVFTMTEFACPTTMQRWLRLINPGACYADF